MAKITKLWSPVYKPLVKKYVLKYKIKGKPTQKKMFDSWEEAISFSEALMNNQ